MNDRQWRNLIAELRAEWESVRPVQQATGRWQDALIEAIVAEGSSVLDLGCGRGQLLARLVARKHVRGQGVEVDPAMVFETAERGVPVMMTDLDTGLKGFPDRSFDYVVLEETLQTLRRPAEVLDEMLRVGRVGIVSFPNFGYWRIRAELLVFGRMPKTGALPYDWHDTPNIHLCTVADFLAWCGDRNVRVREGHVWADGALRPLREGDELAAEEVLLVVERDGAGA